MDTQERRQHPEKSRLIEYRPVWRKRILERLSQLLGGHSSEELQSWREYVSKESQEEGPITEPLRQAIQKGDRTLYQLSMDSGVSIAVISRFSKGERDIRLATADRIAMALGLRLPG